MNLVVVQMQALALAVADLQFPGGVILANLERHAGIDAGQDTNETFAKAIPGGNLSSNVLLGVLGGVEVADLPAELPSLAERGLFQSGCHLLAVLGEVLVGNAGVPQIVLETLAVGNTAQSATKEETVKTAEDATDKASESG